MSLGEDPSVVFCENPIFGKWIIGHSVKNVGYRLNNGCLDNSGSRGGAVGRRVSF